MSPIVPPRARRARSTRPATPSMASSSHPPRWSRRTARATGRSARARLKFHRVRVALMSLISTILAPRALAASAPAAGDTYATSSYYQGDAGVVSLDLQGTRTCWDESTWHQRPDVLEVLLKSTIPLEVITGWASQRMATLVLGILLREKLGYTVEYKTWDKDGSAQQLLGTMTQTGRQYVNVLYGKSVFDLELWPVSGATGRTLVSKTTVGTIPDYTLVGALGQVARNGWYLNADAVPNPELWSSLPLLNSSGAFDQTKAIGQRLTLSIELNVTDLSQGSEDDKAICPTSSTTVSWYGGTLDCVTGSWAPVALGAPVSSARCCTRYYNRTNECTSGMRPCVALVSNNPAWVKSEHERRVIASGLPLEIIYENSLAVVEWAKWKTDTGTPTPVLFYRWEPDLAITEQTYIRIALQDPVYCSASYLNVDGDVVIPERLSNSYAHASSSPAQSCDFSQEVLEKGAHEPSRIYFSDAFYLVEELQITFTNIQNLLGLRMNLTSTYPDVTEREFAAACQWLKEHESAWSDYIIPNTYYFTVLWKVALALGCFLIYVIVQQMRVFRRGEYYDTQKRKGEEVLAAMEQNPIFMLDRLEQKEFHVMDDLMDLEEESLAGLPELSFKVRELHVGDDEYGVKLTIVRNHVDNVPAHAELEITSLTAKLGLDYDRLVKEDANGPGSLNETEPGGRTRVEFEPGQCEMRVVLPFLSNACWTPATNLFITMTSVKGEGPARIFPIDSVAVFIHAMGFFPEGFRLSMTDGSSFNKILRFLFSFLDEAIDLEWIIPLTWRYQLVNCIMALLDTFVWSFFFAILVNEGLLQRRSDWCILVAMVFVAIELFRYHIGLHYFPGSYVLQTHLEVLLGKKFSSLSTADLEAIGSAESLFRVSASTDTNTIRTDLWARLHATFIDLYRLAGASVFIAYSFKDQQELVGYTIGMIGVIFLGALFFISFRIRKSYVAGIMEDELEVMVYDTSHYLYRNTGLVRESHTEARTSDRQYEKLWLFLDGGIFERWYQDYFNKWTLFACLTLVIALMYGFAPQILAIDKVTVGMFIAIVTSISQLGNAVIAIADNISVMLASVSKVAHMAALLNIRSSRRRRLDAMHKLYQSGADGEEDETKFHRNHESNSIQTLCSVNENETACIYLDRMTLTLQPPEQGTKAINIFTALSAFDQHGTQVQYIPAGGFIGIRETRGTFSRTLMNLLAGTDVAFSGVGCINPRYETVVRLRRDKESILMCESLMQNLLVGITLELSRLPPRCRRARLMQECMRRYDSEFLWKLCTALAFTPSLTGTQYREDWAMVSMTSIATLLDPITVFKITFVQAILQHPDVIMVDGFGDDFPAPDLASAVEVLRLFVEKKLPIIRDPSLRLQQMEREVRTVIWHGSPWSLLAALTPNEFVVNITSKSAATVTPAHVAFNGVRASDTSVALSKIPPAKDIVNPVGITMMRNMRSFVSNSLKVDSQSKNRSFLSSSSSKKNSARKRSKENRIASLSAQVDDEPGTSTRSLGALPSFGGTSARSLGALSDSESKSSRGGFFGFGKK